MNGWRAFFWAAAAYNFVIGSAYFLRSTWGSTESVAALMVISFGIVYATVGLDPRRFGPVLVAAIFGKLGVVALLGPPNWGAGDAALGAIVAGDLLFALGFIVFLWRSRSHA